MRNLLSKEDFWPEHIKPEFKLNISTNKNKTVINPKLKKDLDVAIAKKMDFSKITKEINL